MTVATFGPTADTWLYQNDPTVNYGTDPEAYLRGPGGANLECVFLLRFNLASVPSGSTCNSATLRFTTSQDDVPSATNLSLDVYRLLNTAWTETGATWNLADGASAWAGSAGASTSGTDYDGTSLGSFTVLDAYVTGDQYTPTLTAATIAAQFGGTLNLIVRNGSTEFKNWIAATREHGSPGYSPLLTIDYTAAGGATPAGTQPVTVSETQSVVITGSGSGYTPQHITNWAGPVSPVGAGAVLQDGWIDVEGAAWSINSSDQLVATAALPSLNASPIVRPTSENAADCLLDLTFPAPSGSVNHSIVLRRQAGGEHYLFFFVPAGLAVKWYSYSVASGYTLVNDFIVDPGLFTSGHTYRLVCGVRGSTSVIASVFLRDITAAADLMGTNGASVDAIVYSTFTQTSPPAALQGSGQFGLATDVSGDAFGTVITYLAAPANFPSALESIGLTEFAVRTLASAGYDIDTYDTAVYDVLSTAVPVATENGLLTETQSLVKFPPTQVAIPINDVSRGGWTTDTGATTNLFTRIDELTPDDVDYIQSAPSPTSDIVVLALGPLVTPEAGARALKYRYGKDSAGPQVNLTVELLQSAAVVQTWTHTDIPTGFVEADQTVMGTITDWANLNVRFTSTQVVGGGVSFSGIAPVSTTPAVADPFTATFSVNGSTATWDGRDHDHPLLPYDTAPPSVFLAPYASAGITVDGQFLPPGIDPAVPSNWTSSALTVPCDRPQSYTRAPVNQTGWMYPVGLPTWTVIFAPTLTGTWTWRLRGQDSQGTAYSSNQTFTASAMTSKGFKRVAPTDPRYFAHDDGSSVPGVGTNGNTQDPWNADVQIPRAGANGTDIIRTFSSALNGAFQCPWVMYPLSQIGNFVNPSIFPAPTDIPSPTPFAFRLNPDWGAPDPPALWCCNFVSTLFSYGLSVKTGTPYRVSFTGRIQGASGSLNLKIIPGFPNDPNSPPGSGSFANKVANATALTTPITATNIWTNRSVTYTTAANEAFLGAPGSQGYLYATMEGAPSGTFGWISSISVQEVLGGGLFGPNLLGKSNGYQFLGLDQFAAAGFDYGVKLAQAQSIPVSIRTILLETQDPMWQYICPDGNLGVTGTSSNPGDVPGALPVSNMVLAGTTMTVTTSSPHHRIPGSLIAFGPYPAVPNGFTDTRVWDSVYPVVTTADATTLTYDTAFPSGSGGSYVPLSASISIDNFTSRAGEPVRWLHQVIWRSYAARWGAYRSIFAWETLNEGGANVQNADVTNALALYMHGARVGGTGVDAARHMVSTSISNADDLPKSFWDSMGDIDYRDTHFYPSKHYDGTNAGTQIPAGSGTGRVDTDTALLMERMALLYGANQAGGSLNPLVYGEWHISTQVGGYASDYSDSPEPALVQRAGYEGVWLHQSLFARLTPAGIYALEWYDDGIVTTYNLWGLRKHLYDFMQDIPIHNGLYVDAVASQPAGMTVIGQKDLTNKKAHVWVRRTARTWRTVADGTNYSAITGTVTIAGFTANAQYSVQPWEFSATAVLSLPSPTTVTADGSGIVSLVVGSLVQSTTMDAAFKINPVVVAADPTIWAQDQHDAQRTASSPVEPAEAWALQWTWNGPDANGGVGGHMYEGPNPARTCCDADNIYVPAGAPVGSIGGMYSFALSSTGFNPTPRWRSSAATFISTPAWDSTTNTLLAGATNGILYKLNVTTGATIGTYTAGGGSLRHATLVNGGYAYVVGFDGRLHKVDIATMAAAWVHTPTLTAVTNPVSNMGRGSTPASYSPSRDCLVYMTDDLYVHCILNSNGTDKWARVLLSPHTPGGVVDNANWFGGVTPERGWPVIAEQHGFVIFRLQIAGIPYLQNVPTGHPQDVAFRTHAETVAFLNANPLYESFFVLDLDTGARAFTPPILYTYNEVSSPTRFDKVAEMPFPPSVKVWPNGDEVLYTKFRQFRRVLAHGTTASIVEVGTTVTVTMTGAHGFFVGGSGAIIEIVGVTPSGYNTIWQITSVPSTTTFTFTGPGGLGNASVQGQVYQQQGNDWRWDGGMGEMVLDTTTVAGMAAGEMRHMAYDRMNYLGAPGYENINDESAVITTAGATLIVVHWGAMQAGRIDDRTDARGSSFANPITVTKRSGVVWNQAPSPTRNNTTHDLGGDGLTLGWTVLSYNVSGQLENDTRFWDAHGYWLYWDARPHPGSENGPESWRMAGGGQRAINTYVSKQWLVVHGPAGEIMVFTHS